MKIAIVGAIASSEHSVQSVAILTPEVVGVTECHFPCRGSLDALAFWVNAPPC